MEEISNYEKARQFELTNSMQEKLKIFSSITDEEIKIKLLDQIPASEQYKFIGKLKKMENIAEQLNQMEDEKSKRKTFNYIAKQLKGNSKGLLRLLETIDFKVALPENMLTFKLNNLNDININVLLKIHNNVENYSDIQFKINEKDADDITYSFDKLSAIVAKMEELVSGIGKDDNEADKFYTIYSRLTSSVTYDKNYLWKSDISNMKEYSNEYMEQLRENCASLYGGLVEGKAICAGYSIILHEALQYVGLKSKYIKGLEEKERLEEDRSGNLVFNRKGHAWNQVQIDGRWYNVDPTWDAITIQSKGQYDFMLQSDEEYGINHGQYRVQSLHQICKKKFNFDKISQNKKLQNMGGQVNER